MRCGARKPTLERDITMWEFACGQRKSFVPGSREVVDLLRDAQEELKRSRRGSSGVKGGYSGAGTHALRGMFQGGDGDGDRFRGRTD